MANWSNFWTTSQCWPKSFCPTLKCFALLCIWVRQRYSCKPSGWPLTWTWFILKVPIKSRESRENGLFQALLDPSYWVIDFMSYCDMDQSEDVNWGILFYLLASLSYSLMSSYIHSACLCRQLVAQRAAGGSGGPPGGSQLLVWAPGRGDGGAAAAGRWLAPLLPGPVCRQAARGGCGQRCSAEGRWRRHSERRLHRGSERPHQQRRGRRLEGPQCPSQVAAALAAQWSSRLQSPACLLKQFWSLCVRTGWPARWQLWTSVTKPEWTPSGRTRPKSSFCSALTLAASQEPTYPKTASSSTRVTDQKEESFNLNQVKTGPFKTSSLTAGLYTVNFLSLQLVDSDHHKTQSRWL